MHLCVCFIALGPLQACSQDEMGKGAIQNLEGTQGGCNQKILRMNQSKSRVGMVSTLMYVPWEERHMRAKFHDSNRA